MAPGTWGIPGCTGSRNLHDCISDLRAQVAANQKGIQLVQELIAEFGLRKVHAYMHHIQVGCASNVSIALSGSLCDSLSLVQGFDCFDCEFLLTLHAFAFYSGRSTQNML
jgi:hypothetical protein